MKKIIFGFLLSISAISFVSCDMNDPNEDKFGPSDSKAGWVEFTQPYTLIMTDTVFAAGCRTASVPLTLFAPINTEGINVNYTITDIEGSSAGLETRAFIPANSRQGAFVVSNPESLTSPVEFLVTLTSTDKPNVSGGFPDSPPQTFTVRIVPGIYRYLGVYDVVETSEDGEFVYESEVTLGDEPNELLISNIFDTDPNAITRIFVSDNGTVTFPDFMSNPLFTAPAPTGTVFFQGLSGSSSACGGNINLTFNLRFGAGGAGSLGPVTTVLTKQ